MESGGADGGSEASYESVASEGGYEPASERGRDMLPRIVSASACVDVFRRVRWADAAHAVVSRDEDESGGKALARRLRPIDPCAGLPRRILRFDGAMEAWLEEIPLARDPSYIAQPYVSLNDAAERNSLCDILRAGNRRVTLWYFTLEFLQQMWPAFLNPNGWGVKAWEQALRERQCNIQSTHVAVGRVHGPPIKSAKQRGQWLKTLFGAMQAAKWTPDGEARQLLIKQRLSHASMAIGDCVQIGKSRLYVAGLTGFIAVKESQVLLPHDQELELDEEDEAEEEDDEEDDEEEEEEEEEAEEVKPQPSAREKAGKKGGGKDGGSGKKGRGKGQGDDNEGSGHGGKRGGKGKGRGRGKGKGKGSKGNGGNGDNGIGEVNGTRPAKEQRAKEPGPVDRADRRKLRAELQAKRENLQGH